VGRKSIKVKKNEYTLKFGDPQPDSVTAAVKGIPALSLARRVGGHRRGAGETERGVVPQGRNEVRRERGPECQG